MISATIMAAVSHITWRVRRSAAGLVKSKTWLWGVVVQVRHGLILQRRAG